MQVPARRPLAVGFDEALAARPDSMRRARVSIGGRVAAVRVAGPALFSGLVRTLAPAEGDGQADLSIDLWDAAATGVRVPDIPPPGGPRQGTAGGWLMRSPDRRWLTHIHPDAELCLDRRRGRLVGGFRAARPSTGWHPARPLQHMLIPWIAGLGDTVLHAAMVVSHGAGALVAAPGGHGKSTTAAASLAAGLGVLGDDTVSVEAGDGGWVGHCLHATVKVRTAVVPLGRELAADAVPLDGVWAGESVLYLTESHPAAVVRSARVAAILLPRLSDERASALEPLTAGRAMAQLTREALSLEPGQVQIGFERVSELAAGVPAFRLHVGRDPASIPAVIAPLLERLSGS